MFDKNKVEIVSGAENLIKNYSPEADDVIVVIDALRASNTVIMAFSKKVRSVKYFSDLDEILRFREINGGYIFVGEQNAESIKGFDFNNSPSQLFEAESGLTGRDIAIITTNFAKAVYAIEKVHCNKFVGSLINADALVTFLRNKKNVYGRIFLLAVGRNGETAQEDIATSSYLKCRLTGEAFGSFESLREMYYESDSAKNLKEKGYADDIDFCLNVGLVNLIPVVRELESLSSDCIKNGMESI